MLAQRRPELSDPVALIRAGHVWVNGFLVRNPTALVDRSAAIAVHRPKRCV